ncbi:hypothetical protein [Nannocystis pusilla]|uniref:Uncharacterized protein n=1 Tax=Nannocystis pusilla TaxID=889268 RepID=A0ABS7TTZ7_9BACT|nr:hypothetical protein [Nannocystis pusilla]MBZ5711695.1 hypothetical protein [Nannocystis pusilla]
MSAPVTTSFETFNPALEIVVPRVGSAIHGLACHFEAIVGPSLMANHTVRIDYDRQVIELYAPDVVYRGARVRDGGMFTLTQENGETMSSDALIDWASGAALTGACSGASTGSALATSG